MLLDRQLDNILGHHELIKKPPMADKALLSARQGDASYQAFSININELSANDIKSQFLQLVIKVLATRLLPVNTPFLLTLSESAIDQKWNLLTLSCYLGYDFLVESLLQNGATTTPSLEDKSIIYAAKNDHVNCVRLLLNSCVLKK